jgi:hypothetical protein
MKFLFEPIRYRNRDSSVGKATSYRLEDPDSIPGTARDLFPSPQLPDQLWGLLNLLFNGYTDGSLPTGENRSESGAAHIQYRS